MSDKTRIEWTDSTWNPVVGCSKVSEGCAKCYAEKMAIRLAAMGLEKYGRVITTKGHSLGGRQTWTGRVFYDEKALEQPLHWRKPRHIFVCSMGDLFYEKAPFEFITRVFDVMCSWRWPNKKAEREGDDTLLVDPGHTYQVLTKRPERIPLWLDWVGEHWRGDSPFNASMESGKFPENIWLGVTIENDKHLDRAKMLCQIPAAVRFISCEPLLGPIDLKLNELRTINDKRQIEWLIIGCETGPKRRPCKIEWVKSLIEQCDTAKVPVFVKKLKIDGKVTGDMNLWPEWARRREWPVSLVNSHQ